MKIVVLVKYVPDATGERSFAADGTVDRAATDGLLSELDEYALEQALQIAEDGDDVEVVALTLGPDDAADAIKRALQMGATAGIHINDDAVHGSDALATSAVLAAAIRKAEPDLVLCGMASTDGSMGVLPSMIAERLGWPAATLGATLAVADGTATDPPGRRHGQPDRRGRPAGRGQRDRPVRRGALSVDEGHPGRQEEAGRDLDAGRPGHRRRARSAWPPPGPRCSTPRPGRPRRPARSSPTTTGPDRPRWSSSWPPASTSEQRTERTVEVMSEVWSSPSWSTAR